MVTATWKPEWLKKISRMCPRFNLSEVFFSHATLMNYISPSTYITRANSRDMEVKDLVLT